MAEEYLSVELVNVPEEALSPREIRLERGAAVLRWGAIANAVLAGVIFLLGLLGGLQIIPNLFSTLHPILLGRLPIRDDEALAAVILLLQVDISLMLVVMVGVLAREIWSYAGMWVVALVNILGLIFLGFTPALVTIGFGVACGVILSVDVRAFRMNPVMLKELRGRMRGVRAFVVLTVYLGLMSGFHGAAVSGLSAGEPAERLGGCG